MKHKPSFFGKSAFTVAELLVVVAIIGILVAISIPIFTAEREKARRAVDMDHARQIKTALVLAYSNEEITVPRQTNGQHGYGTWIMLCRKSEDENNPHKYAPTTYRQYPKDQFKDMWCGTNVGVTVNGITATDVWKYNAEVEKILKDAGLDLSAFQIYSKGNQEKNIGWDWIIVEVGYNATGEFITRMYSGYNNQNGSTGTTGESNLEKLVYKK